MLGKKCVNNRNTACTEVMEALLQVNRARNSWRRDLLARFHIFWVHVWFEGGGCSCYQVGKCRRSACLLHVHGLGKFVWGHFAIPLRFWGDM